MIEPPTPLPTSVNNLAGRGSPCSIGGRLWTDGNENGALDTSESVLQPSEVRVWPDANGDGRCETDEAPIASASSNADGSYRIENLSAGAYCVEVITPDGGNTMSEVLHLQDGDARILDLGLR